MLTKFHPMHIIRGIYPRVRYYLKKKHWSERFWWIIAFILSACLCASSIHHIWAKWNNDPVTTTYRDKRIYVSDIPFPSVTICPETKVVKEKLDLVSAYQALVEKSRNLTKTEQTYMDALVHICNFDFPEHVHFRGKFVNDSIYTTLQEMGPLFNSTIKNCYWQTKKYKCSELFSPVLTAEGLCFAFNVLNSKDFFTKEMANVMKLTDHTPRLFGWDLAHGYDDGIYENEYPIRVFNSKPEFGLKVNLELFDRDIEHICRGFVPGFKIFLNTPGQTLKMTRQFLRVPLEQEAQILIKPSYTYTRNILRRYSPMKRKCFFKDERQLRFYKIYTKINCYSECLANWTRLECECTPFSMPRPNGDTICGAESFECYQAAQNAIFGEDIAKGLKDKRAIAFREKCNCKSLCTQIEYDAEIDRAKITKRSLIRLTNSYRNLAENYTGSKSSSVLIAFKDYRVGTMRRSALYTNTDFLAICGGLLGLFLGFSALNAIQLIYCLVVRCSCMLRHFRSLNSVRPFKRSYVISRISIETLESQRPTGGSKSKFVVEPTLEPPFHINHPV